MGWLSRSRAGGTGVDRLRERAMTHRDHLLVDRTCRELLRIGTPEALDVALDAVAAGRFHPWTTQTALDAMCDDIARRWSAATPEGRTSLARILVKTDEGRQTLRDLLGGPSEPWTLICAQCGADVVTITKVPPLWPCADVRGRFRVDPDGGHLLVGDPAAGIPMGHRSGQGPEGAAFDARDVSTLARELRWGLRFVCPEEPTVWCPDHVEVMVTNERTDLDDGWHQVVTTHVATYPDGHRREVARRTITDA